MTGDACAACAEVGPLLVAPGTSGRPWKCETCGRVWTRDAPPPTAHPAALVLADHQLRPHVWAQYGAGVQVVCRCNDWSGWDYDHPAHLAEALDRAGLLKEDT